jgi:hypothetical protein
MARKPGPKKTVLLASSSNSASNSATIRLSSSVAEPIQTGIDLKNITNPPITIVIRDTIPINTIPINTIPIAPIPIDIPIAPTPKVEGTNTPIPSNTLFDTRLLY